MSFQINFNEEKNQLLLATRGISFEDIITAIADGGLRADIAHPSQQYPHQKMYVVQMKNVVYAVPYVINEEKNEIFLKTLFPSRVLTKKYKK